MADLWGGLRQAHQSLPLRGAGDSGQLQAMGLQLGDSSEEGGRRQGGGGEVRGTAALLLVPTEVEGHLLPYRRRPGAPLVLHCCGVPRKGKGVTTGSRTGCPMLLGWASFPPHNFSGMTLHPPPGGCLERNGQGCRRMEVIRGLVEGRGPRSDTPPPRQSKARLPPASPRPGPGRGAAGTVFVHVDLQALLQPAGPALVPVRLVHRAASLQRSQAVGPGGAGPSPRRPPAPPPRRREAGRGPPPGGPGRAGRSAPRRAGRAAFSTRDSAGGAPLPGAPRPAGPAPHPRGDRPRVGTGAAGAGRGKSGAAAGRGAGGDPPGVEPCGLSAGGLWRSEGPPAPGLGPGPPAGSHRRGRAGEG